MKRLLFLKAPSGASQPKHDKHHQRLPLELWMTIIELILDEIRHPYLYCTPETFPRYHSRFPCAGSGDRDIILQEWMVIRLVCRAWRRLAGPQPHVWIRQIPSDFTLPDALDGVSSITIHQRIDAETLLLRIALHSSVSSNLTTIVFGNESHWQSSQALLDNPWAFPNVRCLSILQATSPPSFWQALQDGYPQLASLKLRFYTAMPTGNYTFPNLEILDTYVWWNFQLSCPSLKHFALRNGCTDTVVEFLTQHGPQMQSLFLDFHVIFAPRIRIEGNSLWTIVPNLHLFGGEASFTLPSPPPNHPLRHLRLFSQPRSLSIARAMKQLTTFQEVTHLHIQSGDIASSTIDELQRLCLARKVELIDVTYAKPVLPRASAFSARWLRLVSTRLW